MTQLEQSLLQYVPDAVVVVDAHGRILFANERVDSLLGVLPAELVGKSIEVLIPARFGGHADKRDAYMRSPGMRPMGAGLDLVALHKDGSEVPVDISLRPAEIDGAPHVVAALRDVREKRALQEQMKLQAVALEAAASGIMITRVDGVITWVNPAACAMSGYSADELVGQPVKMLRSGVHPSEFFQALWSAILDGRTWSGVIVNRHKSGTHYHEEQTIAPVRSARGDITHFVAVRQDISARVLAEQELRATRDELARRVHEVEELHDQLREQATRDPLTGLFNRRYLDETLVREVARAARDGSPLVVAVLDIDHFKRINDSFGHAMGDRVLSALATVIVSRSRTGDVACRFGGEEFVVVLVGATLEAARRRAEEWRSVFAALEVHHGDESARATVSIGLAALCPGEDSDALFARADAALYVAKDGGRDRIVVAAPGPAQVERDPAVLRAGRP